MPPRPERNRYGQRALEYDLYLTGEHVLVIFFL